jgi:hypothetical protein
MDAELTDIENPLHLEASKRIWAFLQMTYPRDARTKDQLREEHYVEAIMGRRQPWTRPHPVLHLIPTFGTWAKGKT